MGKNTWAWPSGSGDMHHYETLYFRPAGSNTINAIQYMPEKKDEFNRWDYEADKYQAKATLPATEWFHIKAVVKGQTLTVYVDHQPKPAMVYKALDPELQMVQLVFGSVIVLPVPTKI